MLHASRACPFRYGFIVGESDMAGRTAGAAAAAATTRERSAAQVGAVVSPPVVAAGIMASGVLDAAAHGSWALLLQSWQ